MTTPDPCEDRVRRIIEQRLALQDQIDNLIEAGNELARIIGDPIDEEELEALDAWVVASDPD